MSLTVVFRENNNQQLELPTGIFDGNLEPEMSIFGNEEA